MAEVKLAAETRTDFGKGAARRIRRDDKVPGVIYGHGADPKHVTLDGHALMMALKTPNVLLRLDLGGKGGELVIPKEVQRDPLKGFLVHADFLAVKKGEKVTVEVPVHTEGELAPGGNLLEHMLNALPVEAEATHIPEGLTVSIEGLEAGHTVRAGDVPLPRGTTLAVDESTAVLQVVAAQTEALPEEEEAEEAEEGAPAEAAEEAAAPAEES
ncbi:50S ribosomal protein L25/general stress protein Ctc [Streptomyces mobaraensis NBRC 13819 = DSM 40847]|uniref:Large ribosomal subunit protein bL25 n=2 Tax=Streptomyces mobaraensis TaxID=35621 RepID=A0A5N5W4P6_STRMB|nr:50S ribosomal protein L25/general stress protein Ctc [Streptomyces mobaraensis]EMF00181.1 50S ribosomal protein L25/general stress protein Ctc [Streptomyces mobaraensis NBRC 13819 = DSM 40847]KAB7839909.1 50S ribosomal protein L25/general stress protein Ctc [Streptomyces mobaraensis]QTT72473.1 50S ribosomal protein L25/general stress protein Ctc [Streptomyces mobaraensis NBRC 13819 = DSM 40847]